MYVAHDWNIKFLAFSEFVCLSADALLPNSESNKNPTQ